MLEIRATFVSGVTDMSIYPFIITFGLTATALMMVILIVITAADFFSPTRK